MGTRVWAGLLLSLTLLAGCSDDGHTFRHDGESAEEFAHRVVKDEKATPAEIAEAGEKVATYEYDGRTLTTYEVNDPGDGGEIPSQIAWRVTGADGALLGEGKTMYSMDVFVLADGFLIRNGGSPRLQHVGRDGVPHAVRIGPARPTRPGDVVVGEGGLMLVARGGERTLVYRPGTATEPGSAALLPQAPVHTAYPVIQDDAVTEDGTVWVQIPEVRPQRDRSGAYWSPDGRRPWRTSLLPIPATSFTLGHVTAIGTDVYLFSAHGWIGGGERMDALWVRRSGPGHPWRALPLTGIRREKREPFPSVRTNADGQLEITLWDRTFINQGDHWREVP